jgi:molybdopterin-containing oxidoreductase family iron-sulfur binding subunit
MSSEGEERMKAWRSLEERTETPAAKAAALNEFKPGAVTADPPPTTDLSRRHFLGLAGTVAALATTGCDWGQDRSKIVPYTRRPQEVVPGVANFYASTFPEGRRSYAVLVKTREGRPIHIMGNDEHPGLKGKTSPRAVASVLGLYDPDRLRGPRWQGRPASWAEAEQRLDAFLAAPGVGTLLIMGATDSPTRQQLLAQLEAAMPSLDVVAWEPASGDSAQEGALTAFGEPVQVRLRLEQAKVILALGADFLNGDDPEAIRAFTAKRRPRQPGSGMNRLWVLEGPLSLTGTRADHRHPVRPSLLAAVGFALAADLHDHHGLALPKGTRLPEPTEASRAGLSPGAWRSLLKDLRDAGPEAVVLCGEAMPPEAHVAAHLLNAMLKSRAVALGPADPTATLRTLQGTLARMASGRYHTAILWGVNPAYAFPDATAWRSAFAAVPNRVWLGLVENESSAQCHLVLPEHHWLEAWGDHRDGECLTLQQPAVGPLFDTRQGEEILLKALKGLGRPVPDDYHAYLQARWVKEVLPPGRTFQEALHDGLLPQAVRLRTPPVFRGASVAGEAGPRRGLDGFELVLRPGTQVHDGRYANNAWLQELPDPITKVTWGNPLSVSVADAQGLGLSDGDFALLRAGGSTWRLPVVVQPGQAEGVLALALGYGSTAGEVAKGIGTNAYPLMAPGRTPNLCFGVTLAKGLGHAELPVTQNHHRMDGRDLVRSYDLAQLAEVERAPRPEPALASLYPPATYPGPKWGMAIDLSTCVGCGACVLACQSENNIPTVGPEQVVKGREMHWLRIDRYYVGSARNPERVHHQPMLCQHCEAAPCENVCPVNATNHSPDGLNQMVYQRCVGTRYCANNCPYKVRRFNFHEYNAGKKEPASLVFNPEVTVRPRGVMEKCTFCVQRIQDGRIRAQGEHRELRDGDITPACAVACPSEAIVFGNLLDPLSRVAALSAEKRGYKVLEELGARPAITYLAELRNPHPEGGPHEP